MLRRQRLLGCDHRRHGDRLRIEGAAMQHAICEHIDKLRATGDRRDRKAVGDRLRHDGEVRRHAEALLRPAAAEAKAGDDLVEDQ